MSRGPSQQGELDFAAEGGGEGLLVWQAQRAEAVHQLAKKMGLPLGHRVEVHLADGIRLNGTLRLREDRLFVGESRDLNLELTIGEVPFTAREIEACVRLD